MRKEIPSLPLLIGTSVLYMLVAGGFYIAKGNHEFIAYLGVSLGIGAIILYTLPSSGLDGLALWGLSGWGFMHMMGGLVPVGDTVLYGWVIIELFNGQGDFVILKMDQVIHFYGFAVAAIVVHQLLACRMPSRVSGAMMIFLAWIGSMGLGAFNEVVEFLAYVSLDETGVGDLYNTGLDLCFNLIGAFCGAFFSEYRSCRAEAQQAQA